MTSKIGWLRGAAAFVALSSVVSMAQTVDDPDSGFQVAVHPTVPDSYQMSWWAKSGHTYFLQHTTDLKLWTNLDVMEEGTDAVMNFGFAATGVGDFWRLSWTDQVSSNPATADFDSDELTNGYELYTSHTDPLKFDTDGDAMSDKWEIDNSLDPRAQTDGFADADSDGWNNGAEYNRKAKGSGAFTADALSASVGNSLTNWPGGGTEPPPTVGLTTGTLGVDKNGAATYNIPLWVVPGTAGMQPQLALNYSSQSGAGWLGFGWSMSGLSMISRGPQTMAVDENVTGVNFSGTDRFYLDGQRLIAIGTGSYGADGMEYRTEIDSVSKIVANGTAGTGPAWFEVKTKAGLTIEFGHTADSAVDAKNETALGTQTSRDEEFAWAVNKISDTVGNYMEFIYTEDADGHRIERINYTKNGASDHYASVQFVYESRNDISRGYVFGHPVARNLRLKTIAMYYGTTKMREYVLNYANRDLAPSDGKGRSLLMSVQEKTYNASGAASAYPLLEFDYETPGSGWTQLDAGWAPPALLGRHQQSDGEGTGFVDVNGDGRPDLLQYRAASNGTTTARGAWLNTPTGWVSANGGSDATDYRPPKPLAQDTFTGSDSRFVDLDGDGLPDFVDMITGVVYFNTGTGFAQSPASPSGWSFPTPTMSEGLMAAAIENLKSLLFTSEQEASSYPVNIDSVTYERTRGMFIDVDGDGRPDFVGGLGNYAVTGSAIGNTATTHMSEGDGWRNTGSGWERNTNYVNKAAGLAGTRLMDVSGDGRLDVVRNWYGSGTPVKGLWLGTDTGMTYDLGASDARIPPAMLNAGGPGQDNLPVGTEAVDLNGDGLTDIISFNNSSGTSIPNKAYFNKSNGWLEAAFNSPFELTHDNTPQGIAFLDVNSDGLADVIKAWETSSSAYDVRLGTGSGWSASATAYKLPRHIASNGHPTTGTDFVDFDGDGAIDQIWSWQEGGDTAKGIALNQAKPADRLKTITNGFGVVAEITYAPLTEPNADPDLKLYTKGTGGPSDTANVIGPLYVVKTVLNDDGAGGQHIVSYRYGGLRSHRLRGSLGFEWMQTTDSRTGIVSRTDFKQ
ncbi:MAG: VCBS repeat-containing protein, partial [Verrucomicrobia bacterium]|nr:VCBS repeat-containing protein [Verrucomicrobiota bacterium]